MILDDVGPDIVVNPILWRKGIKSMLGVPIVCSSFLPSFENLKMACR